MDWSQMIDSFDLYDHRVFYHQIEPVSTIELHIPIDDWERLLLFDSDT